MTHGFITMAQQATPKEMEDAPRYTPKHDYLRMAYALALSLRATQSAHSGLTVMVSPGQVVPDKYREVFDQVVEMPWHDCSQNQLWKVQNKWKAIHVSPYEHTILLDADMLFTVDISDWWQLLKRRNFWASTTPFTFRGDKVQNTAYREMFDMHKLPHIYTALTYFDKSELSYEVFKAAELVFYNWDRIRTDYFKDRTPDIPSGDLGFATAIKMLNREHECTWDGIEFFGFTHMKTKVQGFEQENYMYEDWNHHLRTVFKPNLTLSVGNYVQMKPFHYHVKEFLTDQIIETLENYDGC